MDTSEDNINYIENIICDTISDDNCKTAVQEFQVHSGNPSVFKLFYYYILCIMLHSIGN